MINQAMILFYGILAALVIPGLIAMVNTLAINVIERTREIGVLRAVGATRQAGRPHGFGRKPAAYQPSASCWGSSPGY